MGFGIFLVLLLVTFSQPLARLLGLAWSQDLHSHILLIPAITGYLLFVERERLPKCYATSWLGACLLAGIGAGVLLWAAMLERNAATAGQITPLSVTLVAMVCFVNAGGFLFLGGNWMCAAAFPMAFLLFLTPLPEPVVHWTEHQLKVVSADASALLFNLTGLPYLRDGLVFQLPGITIEVADECSGIRSSYVLFITSTLAGYLFLRSPWRRALLALAVIPLGILRNGFRILVISWLCVEVSPEMIDSVIHHKGGPIFFALSLIPLFLLLWWLRRGEVRRARVAREAEQLETG